MRRRLRWLRGIAVAGVAVGLAVPTTLSGIASAGGAHLHDVAAGATYSVDVDAPDPYLERDQQTHYPDTGGHELTDGKLAAVDYLDPAWVGFLMQTGRTVTVDLGSTRTIRSLSTDFLFFQSAAVFLPGKVTYALSTDARTWRVAGVVPGNSRGIVNEHRSVDLAIDPTYARYVKVHFDANGYAFADEFTAIGSDGVEPGARAPHGPVYRPEPQPSKGFRQQGTPQVNGVHDMYLAHTYGADNPWRDKGKWTVDDLMPIVSHVDESGKPTDWMFDTVLWVAGGGLKPYYEKKSQWDDLKKRIFAPGLNIDAMNAAVAKAQQTLDPNGRPHKAKIVLPIPEPVFDSDAPWGVLDGKELDFDTTRLGEAAAQANRYRAVTWFADAERKIFESKHYSHLELAGFYWTDELISPESSDSDLVKRFSGWVHASPGAMKLYWIPYYQAPGWQHWQEYGIDGAMMQPNYFFDSNTPLSRLPNTTRLARAYGLGVEMEGDEAMLTSTDGLQRYNDYLDEFTNSGAGQAINGYYWGTKATTLGCVTSPDPAVRKSYDDTYRYIANSR